MSGHVKNSWSQEISPYLKRLADALRKHGRSKETITIQFCGSELKLCTREQKLVLTSQQTGGVELPPRLQLVKCGIGLQAKILCDLQQLETSDNPVDIKNALEALKSDGVIGSRIAYEMRAEINELTSASRMDESMRISENRSALRSLVERANSVAEADPKAFLSQEKGASSNRPRKKKHKKSQAEIRHENEVRRANALAKVTADALAATKKGTSAAASLSAELKASLKHRNRNRKTLAIALVVVFFFVTVGVTISMTWQKSLPTFSATDFNDIPGLEDVIIRSPEILIIVNHSTWNDLTPEEKTQAVMKIGETVGPAGYQLAEFRTLLTPGLAFWTKDGTIEVAE